MPDKPVLLADFPAQATGFLLENWQTFRVNEILASKGSHMVSIIFAADDQTAMMSAAKIFRQFGAEQSDYVIIKNPARAKCAEFEKTKVYASLKDAGAREIHLPSMTPGSLAAVQELAKKKGHHVSLSEAAQSPDVALVWRFEIQHFLNVTMTQMEDNAEVLLPSPAVIKNKVSRAGAMAAQDDIDPFDL